MINRISIFVLLFFFATHATGTNICLFKLVYLTPTEIANSKSDTTQNQTNTVEEEEVKEEAFPTDDQIVVQFPDRNIHDIDTNDTSSISNFLLEIVSPPPEA